MSETIKPPYLYTFVLYLCGLTLFLEWLYPVGELGITSNLKLFIIYALFVFFISLLQINWLLSFIVKGSITLYVIHQLFYQVPFFSGAWIRLFLSECIMNIQALFMLEWHLITDLFRNVLLLLLIWLTSYLIYYWFIIMKRIFLFVLLTVIYIALLDTFTIYDASMSIIRIFVISFIALGMARLAREVEQESISFSWMNKMHLWLLPLIGIVLLSTLIGYTSPKWNPKWPDPVPFIMGTSDDDKTDEQSKGGKVGYGENDTQLGGDFQQDFTPVFQAAVTNEHYWRIETKDEYTGKGWEETKEPDFLWLERGKIPLYNYPENVKTVERHAVIDFQPDESMGTLIYPYGMTEVETTENTQYLMNINTEAIKTNRNNQPKKLEKYTLKYNDPLFDLEELHNDPKTDPTDISERYTKLPNSLPKRVSDLAAEVTADAEGRLEKAFALESYFGANGFTYETTGIPVPEGDEDYVDQFLFDTKAGYCDNYSTSMVVMLRTLDIPARWVKGFTSGEKISTADSTIEDDVDIYEVTNANAHSWVEVYFPSVGWVPFEPTQGFSNLADFEESTNESGEQLDEDNVETEEDEIEIDEPDEGLLDEEEMETSDAQTDVEKVTWSWKGFIILLLALLIGSFIIYVLRFHLQKVYIAYRWKKKKDEKTFELAYHYLLTLLSHKYVAKRPDQTLREYAKQIDLQYGTKEMGQLTSYYEQMLYNRNNRNQKGENEQIELWKSLVEQIMA